MKARERKQKMEDKKIKHAGRSSRPGVIMTTDLVSHDNTEFI